MHCAAKAVLAGGCGQAGAPCAGSTRQAGGVNETALQHESTAVPYDVHWSVCVPASSGVGSQNAAQMLHAGRVTCAEAG